MFEQVVLYHSVIDARSRFIRSFLSAKGIEFDLYAIEYWHPKEQRIKVYKGIDFSLSAFEVCTAKKITCFNSAQRIPILVCNEGTFVGGIAIVETVNENYAQDPMFGTTIKEKAENRRLLDWFFHKFEPEVYTPILQTIYYKQNNFNIVTKGRKNLSEHLKYMEHILLKNTFGIDIWQQATADERHTLREEAISCPQSLQLVSMNSMQNPHKDTSNCPIQKQHSLFPNMQNPRKDTSNRPLGIADYCAGAYISSLDYFGEISWAEYPIIKSWYQRIKVQPHFAPILDNLIPEQSPPDYYKKADF